MGAGTLLSASALGAALLGVVGLTGCTDPLGESVLWGCVAAEDCPIGERCVDGLCVPTASGPAVDAEVDVDADPDAGASSDSGADGFDVVGPSPDLDASVDGELSETAPDAQADSAPDVDAQADSAPDVDAVEEIDAGPSPPPVILLVGDVGSTTMDEIAGRIGGMGLGADIAQVNNDDLAPSDLAGAVIAVVTEKTDEKAAQLLKDEAIPVMTWAWWLYDDFGMTAGPDDQGLYDQTRRVRIVEPSHPVAAGLTNAKNVYSEELTLAWGVPAGEGVVVVRHNSGPQLPVVFVFDTGQALAQGTAPARRLGFFLGDDDAKALNGSGWQLFDASFLWTLGEAAVQ